MKRYVCGAGLLLMWSGVVALAQPASTPQDLLIQQQKRYQMLGDLHPEKLFLEQQLMKAGKSGKWWSNPAMAQRLNLTADQQKKMDDIFQQYRIQLIDLNAGLEKAEAVLEPLMGAEQPDDAKVMAQIDRVAQARADLEKTNSRMLWSIRRVLTPDQWKNLQAGYGKPAPKPVR